MRKAFIRVMASMAVLVLVAASIVLLVQNSELRRETKQLLAARVYPYPLTSLFLETPETKVVREERSNSSPPAKYLILVSEDACGACRRNMKYWVNTTQSLRAGDRVEVWLLSFDAGAKTEAIVSDLSNRHIAYRMMQISDGLMFSLKTGLVATPTTLVLDKEKRPVLVLEGLMNESIESQFRRVLHGGSPAPRNPFLIPAPAEPAPPFKAGAKTKPVALGPCTETKGRALTCPDSFQ